jgi:SAM-dependent methyltransferase
MSSYQRQQLEAWLKTIDVKADSVLDIGGSQLPIKGRTKSWEVKDYKILDLENPHQSKKEPDFIMDLNWDNNYIVFKKDKKSPLGCKNLTLNNCFDIVFCLEVSEYWYNPYQALKNIKSFLKPGGILYLSTHFLYPVHNPKEYDFTRYTKNGTIKLLEETGFKVEQIIPREVKGGEYLMQFYVINGMKYNKDTDHFESGYLIKATYDI